MYTNFQLNSTIFFQRVPYAPGFICFYCHILLIDIKTYATNFQYIEIHKMGESMLGLVLVVNYLRNLMIISPFTYLATCTRKNRQWLKFFRYPKIYFDNNRLFGAHILQESFDL